MASHPERIELMLDELQRNPRQCFDQVVQNVSDRKNLYSQERGGTSEAIAIFLISRIPEVAFCSYCHHRVDGLDSDIQVDFINTKTVSVQVKSTDVSQEIFFEKIKEKEKKLKRSLRFVVLSVEKPFEEIVEDFITQVNNLDGKRTLSLNQQKRKRY